MYVHNNVRVSKGSTYDDEAVEWTDRLRYGNHSVYFKTGMVNIPS